MKGSRFSDEQIIGILKDTALHRTPNCRHITHPQIQRLAPMAQGSSDVKAGSNFGQLTDCPSLERIDPANYDQSYYAP